MPPRGSTDASPRSADAEWSGGSLVLDCDGASAFVDAVRRDGLEVAR